MPLLSWRCLCLPGSLVAHSAVTTLARPFSSSRFLRARPRPLRRCRQQERSRATSLSRNKNASAPQRSGKQGILHAHPHADTPLFAPSSPPPASLTTTVDEAHTAGAPRGNSSSTEEKERDLLRYFGRGRCLYDTVSLQSASFALQRASCTQAQRVPLATLFPAPPRLDAQPSPSLSAAACLTEESPRRIGVEPSASFPVDMAVATAEAPALTAPSPVSPPLTHFAPSNLFSHDELQGRHHSDWLQFRLLSARFSSASDSNKFFGAAEVPLRDVCADMAELWSTACMAWEEAVRACSAAMPLSRQHSVCFLIGYAQTQQRAAVGASMQRIAEQVCGLTRTNSAPQLFRVIPVFIGMRTQATLKTDSTVCDSPLADVGATIDPRKADSVTYAKGGLYTLAGTVQCITRLGPHAFNPRMPADASPPAESSRTAPELLCTLEPQIFLLSDSWLHVRSVADLHSGHFVGGYSASDSRGGLATASPASERDWDRRSFKAPSFVPESTRRSVHVVPSVVTDHLSRKEERAVARYVWCDVQRRLGGHRTTETLQPPPPLCL
ncbi:hypothetical protein LSCM4_05090 [Leishmania orientalis]|uniref:Uncharacterized protein n=1 Tax=Leishmania orientalis TaxID=2249476 RepID=A0A836GYE6_9TRYP|nr:hypothetical protein LSCM4_05090 [Leishmania orientalis]